MPLKTGKSRKVVGDNIREMQAAGYPHNQAVAASLRKAGVKRKGTAMKSATMTKGDGMDGSKGMSPRKAIASSLIQKGNFGAKQVMDMNMGAHPDHTASTGAKGPMMDGERATRPAIHHTKGHMPAQAAPAHGPHHPGGYGDHARGGKV